MKMYVFSPYGGAWKVSYLTNALSTNDRLFINEIKSEVSGVVSPGLCSAGQALDLPHDYLETTHKVLLALAVAKCLTLTVHEDGETVVSLNTATADGATLLTYTIPTATGIVIGTVPDSEGKYAVSMNVPNGTNVTALVATFTKSISSTIKVGVTAQTTAVTANNFTSPVEYVLTSESTLVHRHYVVTVTVLEA